MSETLTTRLADSARRFRQSHCPHERLTTSITHTLICQQCQLDHTGILLVALNDRLTRTRLALAQLGLEPCVTCHDLLAKTEMILLPLVNLGEPEADDETLHGLFCGKDALSYIETYEVALTDDQLRWFGEHMADAMPSWLREEMTERIGYRSKDLS